MPPKSKGITPPYDGVNVCRGIDQPAFAALPFLQMGFV
jgi:hypothetical protein